MRSHTPVYPTHTLPRITLIVFKPCFCDSRYYPLHTPADLLALNPNPIMPHQRILHTIIEPNLVSYASTSIRGHHNGSQPNPSLQPSSLARKALTTSASAQM